MHNGKDSLYNVSKTDSKKVDETKMDNEESIFFDAVVPQAFEPSIISDFANVTSKIEHEFRIRKSLFIMVKDRGYTVADSLINETFESYYSYAVNASPTARHSWQYEFEKKSQTQVAHSKKLIAFLPKYEEKIGVLTIKKISEKIQDLQLPSNTKATVILVMEKQLTPLAQKHAQELTSLNIYLETFLETDLLIGAPKSHLCPQVARVFRTMEEKKEFISNYSKIYSCNTMADIRNTFPKLAAFDPLCRWYGLRKDDIVAFIRRSQAAGRYMEFKIITS